MSDGSTSQTSTDLQNDEALRLSGWRKNVAILALEVGTATTLGVRWCFQGDSATTQRKGSLSDSSTAVRRVPPEVRAQLDSILAAAHREIVEDGMSNAVTERLAELFLKDFEAVIAALAPLIESEQTQPAIAAEVLKELGRISDAASHGRRCWILARALNSASPFVRDGAGLGLARLADPATLHYLRNAVDIEQNAEIRADLQLVIDEILEMSH